MEKQYFADFELETFWEDTAYALKEYIEKPPSDDMIAAVEQATGYPLPPSYIAFMRMHNGGIPCNTCFPTRTPTSWAKDHVEISGFYSIGDSKPYSLLGLLGSRFMIEEWGYPDIGICICTCPSAGHDIIMLDYTKSNNGKYEPAVVHVSQETGFKKTLLAKNFEQFVRGLISDEYFDTSEEELKSTLRILRTGNFSSTLLTYMKREKHISFDRHLRNILLQLTNHKGAFALQEDELSYLVYDIQFYLYTQNQKVYDTTDYLKEYPQMLALSDNEISTNGYAASFVENWLNRGLEENKIISQPSGVITFSKEYEQELLRKVQLY
ncbi:SMI1-KNR4 cell-wall [Filimonas lacunae]|uniref:SMI1-KNR4 cell-wall n=1 Tax=Filimonas lacunae TaxID=477680 RepID=A0A173M9Y3_9BACT|nr:SMI1/KNR4 family protein [Filimonas lacunae]BAV04353.1 hypothetical protein FLA_0341 [Filimonas lacunae]SIT31109.1 SMI1-KNR4 cell-wall [Filimonas lacunae]